MISFPILLTVIDIITETSDSKSFILEKPEHFTYISGQYLTIQISDSVSQTRSYSLSSAPHEKELRITIKKVDNGLYSRWALDHIKAGDQLKVVGVYGEFTAQKNTNDYILFAAGSGIVPIFSIIKDLLNHNPQCKIQLHYSSPNPEGTIFYQSLQEFANDEYPYFQITYYFSQIKNDAPKRLSNFDIPELIKGYNHNTLLYICGPVDYMDIILINARTHGMNKKHIFMEDYLAYHEDGFEGEETEVPPDTALHQVSIRINNQQYSVPVQYPKSILESAIEAGIRLPYSCFSGQCGNCLAKKTSGEVFMIYNQVLTEEEIREGFLLTCQGFPIHGDAAIEY